MATACSTVAPGVAQLQEPSPSAWPDRRRRRARAREADAGRLLAMEARVLELEAQVADRVADVGRLRAVHSEAAAQAARLSGSAADGPALAQELAARFELIGPSLVNGLAAAGRAEEPPPVASPQAPSSGALETRRRNAAAHVFRAAGRDIATAGPRQLNAIQRGTRRPRTHLAGPTPCCLGTACPYARAGRCLFQHDAQAPPDAAADVGAGPDAREVPRGAAAQDVDALTPPMPTPSRADLRATRERCRNGVGCPFRVLGQCKYLHDEPAPVTSAPQGTLEERYTIPDRGIQHSLDTIFGSWTRRANPREVVIYDPYLASLTRMAPEHAACLTMDCDSLVAFAEQTGVARLTHLDYIHELLAVLHRESPQVMEAKLITRSVLRAPDVRVPALLRNWEQSIRDTWDCLGLRFTLELQDHVHVRRVLLINPVNTVEINLEFGIMIHMEDQENMRRAIPQRRTKRAEALVYNHSGRWEHPPGTESPPSPAPAADLDRPVPPSLGAAAPTRSVLETDLAHDLAQFNLWWGTAVFREEQHVVAWLSDLSADGRDELQRLATFHGAEIRQPPPQALIDRVKGLQRGALVIHAAWAQYCAVRERPPDPARHTVASLEMFLLLHGHSDPGGDAGHDPEPRHDHDDPILQEVVPDPVQAFAGCDSDTEYIEIPPLVTAHGRDLLLESWYRAVPGHVGGSTEQADQTGLDPARPPCATSPAAAADSSTSDRWWRVRCPARRCASPARPADTSTPRRPRRKGRAASP